MADTKITGLTNFDSSNTPYWPPAPASDVIPIVDISDATMAASGTTKKISINNLLSSSPTATGALTVTGLVTAGSATITGDLTVDTSTLKVDSTNNRVGIGTASPTAVLTVNGEISVTDNFALRLGSNQAGGATLLYNGSGNLDITPRSGFHTKLVDGNLIIGTSGKGIDFSATADSSGTMTSELLNDYEEGTFTPTFTASSGTPTTVTLVSAAYTKIGRRVSIDVDFVITAIGTASGTLFLTLPFSQSTASTPCGAFVEVSVVGYMGPIFQIDATRAGLNFYNNATTWVNGYRYRGTYTYNV